MLNRTALAQALQTARSDTLSLFDRFEAHLPDLQVRRHAQLNPPLWELGHVGWFQEFWTTRNPQQTRGLAADPGCARRAGVRADADALYNSVNVLHARRWALPMPDAGQTRQDLGLQLEACLNQLAHTSDDDTGLYFHRLVLLHEDMHHEAGLYMARALDVPVDDPRWQAPQLADPAMPLSFEAQGWTLGSGQASGFAFDNELPGSTVALPAFDIDAQVLRWQEFLPFVEAGGYQRPEFWDDAGRQWLDRQGQRQPLYLRRTKTGDGWEERQHGQWQALVPTQVAAHLSAHEALAWCAWAGRRLPTEAEWELAACQAPDRFRWGDVWEWTASAHQPFAGFVAHPYRDYAAPFFDGRPVLRGGSFLTQPRMKHPRYRNFFGPQRNDVAAGFRTCARAVT
jgi:iron(II)-dependent oxidoreductase